MMIKNEKWLTISETKDYLKCKSKGTVYTIAKKYNVRQSKLLSMVYFSREDIDRALSENSVQMGISA